MLVESKAELKKLSCTKPIGVDDRSGSILLKPKADKGYIPPFKRNHKEKAYFARLDKSKSSYVNAKVSKPMSKPTVELQKKSIFVSTCHIFGVVGHIRPNCSLLRKKPKSETRSVVRNTDVLKFIPVCYFCGMSSHIHPNCHKLKFRHSVF